MIDKSTPERKEAKSYTSGLLAFTQQELKEKYAGKTIAVSVLDVEMKNQRLLGSTERARSNLIIRDVKVGAFCR